MKKKKKSLFVDCLKQERSAIIMTFCGIAFNSAVFLLYDVMIEPLVYAAVVSLALFSAIFVISYIRRSRQRKQFRILEKAEEIDMSLLPEADSLSDASYEALLQKLSAQLDAAKQAAGEERQDMLDYCTAWVHQIKTPIAVMKLQLPDDDSGSQLRLELFRIEQYVDMVLQYIRLGSGSSDLLIREYPLDELIRETVRKYAPQFVGKKLRLQYEPVSTVIITDRKCFCCILEQLLSNAIKYTNSGTITITADGESLTVSDTGIGILPEDLPRIFEKGYTGVNGRLGQKSSGLGLYLARKAARQINVALQAESRAGEGSSFRICFQGISALDAAIQ